mgnify:CR=1 FL=1
MRAESVLFVFGFLGVLALAAIPITIWLVLRFVERTQVLGGTPIRLQEKQMEQQHSLEVEGQKIQNEIAASRLDDARAAIDN